MAPFDTEISKYDALLVLETCNNAISINNIEKLKELVLSLQNLIQFEYAYCFYADLNDLKFFKKKPKIEYVDINFPENVLDEYLKQNLHKKDPVAEEYIKTFKVQNWQEVFDKYQAKGTLPILRDNKIVDGYTHGTINPNLGSAISFSFACRSLNSSDRNKKIIEIIVPHLNEAYNRCLSLKIKNHLHLQAMLTNREIEVLNWLKEGKASWEISFILNISERSINFHVNNIINKLDATNRMHAVAIACSLGIIDV